MSAVGWGAPECTPRCGNPLKVKGEDGVQRQAIQRRENVEVATQGEAWGWKEGSRSSASSTPPPTPPSMNCLGGGIRRPQRRVSHPHCLWDLPPRSHESQWTPSPVSCIQDGDIPQGQGRVEGGSPASFLESTDSFQGCF